MFPPPCDFEICLMVASLMVASCLNQLWSQLDKPLGTGSYLTSGSKMTLSSPGFSWNAETPISRRLEFAFGNKVHVIFSHLLDEFFTRCEDVKQSKYPCWTISLEGIGREIRNTHDLESLNKLKFCIQASALPLPKKTKPFIIRNMHQPAREENCWNKTFGRLPQCFKCLLVEEKLTSEISITRNMFWNSYDIAEKVCFVCM